MNKILSDIDEVVQLFYQQNNVESYIKFDSLLAELIQFVNKIEEKEIGNKESEFNVSKFNEILTEALNALEKKDYVLVADILQYELKEFLESFLKAL